MTQVWAISTALKVDAPKTREGSDSMVLAKDAPLTHAGVLLLDAPKISEGADLKVLAVDIPIVYEGFLTLASEALVSYARTDSRLRL